MFKLFATNCNGHHRLLQLLFSKPKFHKPLSHHLHNRRPETTISNPAIRFILDEVDELHPSKPPEQRTQSAEETSQKFQPRGLKELPSVQISHPWPEWVQLMELLLERGYFEGIGIPFRNGEMGGKESNQIRTACLNFARDRFDLIRCFSRKDIQVVAEAGCPNIDRKVVNSGKRLRAHVGIDEGNVCSSCILRGNCERAYVKAREDEGGRTVDVMRFLLTYGLDPLTGLVDNKPCLIKTIRESVRRLLKEMVESGIEKLDTDPPKSISSKWNSSMQGNSTHQGPSQSEIPMKQGDWICPKCNFLNFGRNIKCLHCDGLFEERLRRLREDQEHLPLKKGDWICNKCNFFNFAKNTRCMQCKENPPKRQLNPGEWECDSCNYINFRRNMVCLKCDHRRPKTFQPVNDNAGLHQSRPYFGQKREHGADKWKFVEDGSEKQDNSNSWKQVEGFVDFPVAGGKSNLSRNLEKQEKWKTEMAEKTRSTAKACENAEEFKSAITRRGLGFLESTDDDEMDEWFGKSPKSENLVSE
ncbi:hypothetical protein LguiB_025259 [Lonicera macranthoides]